VQHKDIRYTTIKTVDDLTDEIMGIFHSVVDTSYPEGPIKEEDWENILDRVDGQELDDGSMIDLGSDLLSPAIKEIKRRVRAHRKTD
jgi:hypothetical protein